MKINKNEHLSLHSNMKSENTPPPAPPTTPYTNNSVWQYSQDLITWAQASVNGSSTYDPTKNFDSFSYHQVASELSTLGHQAYSEKDPSKLSSYISSLQNTIKPYLSPETQDRFTADQVAQKASSFISNYQSSVSSLQGGCSLFENQVKSAQNQLGKYGSTNPALAGEISQLLDTAKSTLDGITPLLPTLSSNEQKYSAISDQIKQLSAQTPPDINQIQNLFNQLPSSDPTLAQATKLLSQASQEINQACDEISNLRQDAKNPAPPISGNGQGQMYLDTNYVISGFSQNDPSSYFNSWFAQLKASGFTSVDLSFAQMNDIGMNPSYPQAPNPPTSQYINADDAKAYFSSVQTYLQNYQGSDKTTLQTNITSIINSLPQYPGPFQYTQACDQINKALSARSDQSSQPPVEPTPPQPSQGDVSSWLTNLTGWVQNNPNITNKDSIVNTLQGLQSQVFTAGANLQDIIKEAQVAVPNASIDQADTFMQWISSNPEQFKQFADLAHQNGVKIDLSFGGALAAGSQFTIPGDPTDTATNLHNFMTEYGIDSVDFDIEQGFPTDPTSSDNFRTFFSTLHSLCQEDSPAKTVLLTSEGGVAANAQGMLKALFQDNQGNPIFNKMFDGLNLMLYSDTDYYVSATNQTYGIQGWMDVIGAKNDPSIAQKIHLGFDDGVNYMNGSEDGENKPISAASNGQAAAMRYEQVLETLKSNGYSTNLGGILVWPDMNKNPYSSMPETQFESDFQQELNNWNTLNN